MFLLGNMLTLTDPDGNVTAYIYDGLGRVITETTSYGTSSAATTSYNYDLDGNLARRSTPTAGSPSTPTTRWTGKQANTSTPTWLPPTTTRIGSTPKRRYPTPMATTTA